MVTTPASPLESLQQWIEQCVIDLSLCPFAGIPYRSGKVRIVVCSDNSESAYLQLIENELANLVKDTGQIETTLIAAQKTLGNFLEFNDFLNSVENLLHAENLESVVQMASFHPFYRFTGVAENDVGNFTNRAPYPVVQWLRTSSVARAVDSTDTLAIPDKNIMRMRSMRPEQLNSLFPWCTKSGGGE